MPISLKALCRGPAALILGLLLVGAQPGPVAAEHECDAKGIAASVKAISILRQVENGLNYLALTQTDAILELSTGVTTLRIRDNDQAFFGPLMGLQKATDKNEAIFADFDKRFGRLALPDETLRRYEDLHAASEVIVSAGFQILRALEDDRIKEAAQIYADRTSPMLSQARADAYNAMSELEREVSLAALRCP